MKSKILMAVTTMLVVAALAVPIRLASQSQTTSFRHYKLIDIGTFGGPNSYVNPTPVIGSHNQVNKDGTTVGGAGTSIPTTPTSSGPICGGFDGAVPFVNHALKWQNGVTTDLGSLVGPANCSVATSINANGLIVGQSENGVIDPTLGFGEVRAVLWSNGVIHDLGTLGGNASFATTINNLNQVTGFALNRIPDAFSIYDSQIGGSSNGTQTRAFLWQNGVMHDLGTLGGPDSWGDFVNDSGQVAGFSYTDSTPNPVTSLQTGLPTTHPFLWEKDRGMTDLGSLGGTLAGSEIGVKSTGLEGALNNQGQVVGGSTLAGDLVFHPFFWTAPGPMQDLGTLGGDCGTAFAISDAGVVVGAADFEPGNCGKDPAQTHAFVWTQGEGIKDLGTVHGDNCAQANAINLVGQIVGDSRKCDLSRKRAALWENGQAVDLNTLIPPNSPLQLTDAFAINDGGVIAGIGLPPKCSLDAVCGHAFVLIPVCADGTEGCADAPLDPAVVQASAASLTQPTASLVDSPNLTAAEIISRPRYGSALARRNLRLGLAAPK
jgi:probable HAF family extracellular repeat protein